MTLPVKNKFDPAFPLVDKDGRPTQFFSDYMAKLDRLVVELSRDGHNALVNAVDDAGAAAAGVPVGYSYRNGSVMMVRVV